FSRFGKPDGNRLFPALHAPALARFARTQRAMLFLVHCALHAFARRSAVSRHEFPPEPPLGRKNLMCHKAAPHGFPSKYRTARRQPREYSKTRTLARGPQPRRLTRAPKRVPSRSKMRYFYPALASRGGERGPATLVAFKAIDPVLRGQDGGFDSHTLPPLVICGDYSETFSFAAATAASAPVDEPPAANFLRANSSSFASVHTS